MKSIRRLLLHAGKTLARPVADKANNKHRELYLRCHCRLNAKGDIVQAQVASDSREVLGCNTAQISPKLIAYSGSGSAPP